MPNGLIKSQFCAGDLTGKKDTCKFESTLVFFFVFGQTINAIQFQFLCIFNFIGQGDSGGPLQV